MSIISEILNMRSYQENGNTVYHQYIIKRSHITAIKNITQNNNFLENILMVYCLRRRGMRGMICVYENHFKSEVISIVNISLLGERNSIKEIAHKGMNHPRILLSIQPKMLHWDCRISRNSNAYHVRCPNILHTASAKCK